MDSVNTMVSRVLFYSYDLLIVTQELQSIGGKKKNLEHSFLKPRAWLSHTDTTIPSKQH